MDGRRSYVAQKNAFGRSWDAFRGSKYERVAKDALGRKSRKKGALKRTLLDALGRKSRKKGAPSPKDLQKVEIVHTARREASRLNRVI